MEHAEDFDFYDYVHDVLAREQWMESIEVMHWVPCEANHCALDPDAHPHSDFCRRCRSEL